MVALPQRLPSLLESRHYNYYLEQQIFLQQRIPVADPEIVKGGSTGSRSQTQGSEDTESLLILKCMQSTKILLI